MQVFFLWKHKKISLSTFTKRKLTSVGNRNVVSFHGSEKIVLFHNNYTYLLFLLYLGVHVHLMIMTGGQKKDGHRQQWFSPQLHF